MDRVNSIVYNSSETWRGGGFLLPYCLKCLKAPVVTFNIYLEDRQHVFVDGDWGVLGTGRCIGCGAIHAMILTPSLDLEWYRYMPDDSIASLFNPEKRLYDEEDEDKRKAALAAFIRLVNPWFTSQKHLAARYDWFGVKYSTGATSEEDVDG